MGDDELTPAEMSRLWAEALVRVVNALAPTTDGLFEAVLNSKVSDLPQTVRVSSARRDDPSLAIVVEEAQAFLSIDSAPGVFVAYEFEGSPADLEQGVESRERGPEPGGDHALSEVDLVEHVDAVMRFGFSFVRFPLFERLKIFGGNSDVALSWGNFDISWPLILVRKWRP
ncbi:hypothetical protein [Amycolatopsis regifaucium]|uniref:Uncharacterized protein n=1 Tax=Amycolatopsis regifaucium TaxID=546365 RepID=A0A154MK98_9PSEU|nr:hypothetical protein [Amycolatopsis regifaucium]KZB84761.1 hypothetical protein AVL48_31615 [Amycolatopsis regifaucium]OKA05254.1 hypothetical protein ATP06_0227280 [Amycolatopsis regifaucium]SFJ62806.1 hypothetical protein SAMN04489731_1281 [Amycolatopsis regifaucium]